MKWVCQTKCYWKKLWTPGDIYEGTRVDAVPEHFEPIRDERMADTQKEIALLRERCQEAGVYYERDWGISQLESAYNKVVKEDGEGFAAPKGRTVLSVDRERAKTVVPKRFELMRECKEKGITVKNTDTSQELLSKLEAFNSAQNAPLQEAQEVANEPDNASGDM